MLVPIQIRELVRLVGWCLQILGISVSNRFVLAKKMGLEPL